MAEEKTQKFERIYTIPLRSKWKKVANYKRTRKAILAIKQYVAKHMKVEDRNLDNVRIDTLFNNEIWYRGRSKPPAKVKVKATRDGDIVRVTFAEVPQHVKFAKAKADKFHKLAEKSKSAEKEVKSKEGEASGNLGALSKEEKAEKAEEKKEEVEKEIEEKLKTKKKLTTDDLIKLQND